MDLVQIGRFIAELRRERGLTQEQLGEKLGVSNKTVSRWETGTYLPPAQTLVEMSALFSVSINELLSGKRLSEQEYKAAAEELLTQSVASGSFSLQEKLSFYQKKWLREHVAAMCCWGAVILIVFALGLARHQPLLTAASALLFVVAHGWRNNAMMAYAEKRVYDDPR